MTILPSEGMENTDTADTAESTLFPLQRILLRRSTEYGVVFPFIFLCSISDGWEEFASVFSVVVVVVIVVAGVDAPASTPFSSEEALSAGGGFATECTLTEYLE